MSETQMYQAINAVSQKVNTISRQLDGFTLIKHKENSDRIGDDESGIVDVADLVSEQNDAILELADIVSELVSKTESEVE